MANAVELLKRERQRSTTDLQHTVPQKRKDSKHSASAELHLPTPDREALEHFIEVTNRRGGQLIVSSQLMGVMRAGAIGFVSWPPAQDGLTA